MSFELKVEIKMRVCKNYYIQFFFINESINQFFLYPKIIGINFMNTPYPNI